MGKTPKKRIQKKRVGRPQHRTEEHKMFDGDVLLYRKPISGDIWQFQMWIYQNQKYLKRTTRCRNLNEAKVVAKELYLDTHGKVRNEQSIFPKSMSEMVEIFLEQKEKQIGFQLKVGRYQTIKSQTIHLLDFIGRDTKITDIPMSKWDDYYNFRREHNPEVIDTTLINERSTIRSVFKTAVTRGHLPRGTELPEFPYLRKKIRRREKFSRDDWKKIYNFMKSNKWLKHSKPKFEEQRKFIRDFVLVLTNTGMRFGEVRRIKWGQVSIQKPNETDKVSPSNLRVKISLNETQTKNKVARVVIGRRGDVWTRIKKYSNYTNPNDFVFVDNDTGEQIVRDTYYKHWHFLIEKLELDTYRTDNTFYCFRHTYASWRLVAHTDVFSLARNMGTSVKFIEDHYGQPDPEDMTDELTKSMDKTVVGKYNFEGIVLD